MSEASTEAGPAAAEDAAWVKVKTPFTRDALVGLVADVEGMMRVNPYLEFAEWREIEAGRYRFRAKNLSNERMIDTVVRVEPRADGAIVHYETGLKARTTFSVEPGEQGSWLVITDDYGGADADERARRIDEVDRSLTVWGSDLHRYFRDWHRWSWLGPWRWYMRRVWRGMKPSARRIAFMLWAVTLFEIAAVVLVVAVFVLEIDKYVF